MGSEGKKIAFELIRFLYLFQSFLGRAQQARVVDRDRGMGGSNREQGGVVLVEDANTFVERFQHTDGLVFDGHRHAEQRLHLKFELIRYKRKMAWVLFDVIQNNMAVRTENRP